MNEKFQEQYNLDINPELDIKLIRVDLLFESKYIHSNNEYQKYNYSPPENYILVMKEALVPEMVRDKKLKKYLESNKSDLRKLENKNCLYCGKELTQNEKICSECGTPLQLLLRGGMYK